LVKYRSPSSALVDSTPHEVWFGKKPLFLHLNFFGYDAFVHVPMEKRNKLDNKTINCIFIGYKDGMQENKLWDLVLRNFFNSREVIFREFRGTSRIEEIQIKKEP
jgi:hypothetical protein